MREECHEKPRYAWRTFLDMRRRVWEKCFTAHCALVFTTWKWEWRKTFRKAAFDYFRARELLMDARGSDASSDEEEGEEEDEEMVPDEEVIPDEEEEGEKEEMIPEEQ